jgi:hypothetical protein
MVLVPIASCGETGVPMMSADRVWCWCHPIFLVFIGDYPEQALVTCTYNGQCPKCQVPRNRLGKFQAFPSRVPSDTIDTFQLADGDIHTFHKACHKAALKPVFRPFWGSLPFADIFLSISPDILHQLLQGVMKHVIAWLASPTVFGSVVINACCRSLPPNHNIALFAKGITMLSRVSGKEHKNICCILLGLILDLPLPGGQVPSRVVKAVHALLDFLYLAQYPSHTTETLQHLEDSLTRFHDNKAVFNDLGTRENFNIPKLHMLLHYQSSITLFGTTDNYNTEQTERMHINFAKNTYRATNHKDEYLQMTTWLEHCKKIQQHAAFIKRQQDQPEQLGRCIVMAIGPPRAYNGNLQMPENPTIKAIPFDDLAMNYGTIDFLDTLADFIAHVNNPGALAVTLHAQGEDTLIPFRAVPVYHRIRFVAGGDRNTLDTVDAVHVRPERTDMHGRIIPSRFNTVLVHNGQDCVHRKKGKSVHINV